MLHPEPALAQTALVLWHMTCVLPQSLPRPVHVCKQGLCLDDGEVRTQQPEN